MRWLTAEAGSRYARHVRADIEPLLCQECAKTVRNSTITDELDETKDVVELRIPRFGDIERNALDLFARLYTPAVGGSIPSAPTNIDRPKISG